MKKICFILIASFFLLGCGEVEKPVNVSVKKDLMNSSFNTSQVSLTVKEPK